MTQSTAFISACEYLSTFNWVHSFFCLACNKSDPSIMVWASWISIRSFFKMPILSLVLVPSGKSFYSLFGGKRFVEHFLFLSASFHCSSSILFFQLSNSGSQHNFPNFKWQSYSTIVALIDDGESTLLLKKVACPCPTCFDTVCKKVWARTLNSKPHTASLSPQQYLPWGVT